MPSVARLFLKLTSFLFSAKGGRPLAVLAFISAALLPLPAAAGEASPYLFDFNLGDNEINLHWEGYWRVTFTAGGGFGKITNQTAFPGLSRGTRFFQEPDLTLTLWLDDRWFLETTFLEDFKHNTYRAGYRGREGEFVQKAVIGNAGINAVPRAGVPVPSPRSNTPGITTRFASERSEHSLMLRYDAAEARKKTFLGPYEVNTQDIPLSRFAEGRYFILPDTGVSSLRVFLESTNGTVTGTDERGDIHKFREAEPAEYFADETNGLLILREAAVSRVAVYYTVGGTAVGDSSLGLNFIVPASDPANGNYSPDLAAWGGVPGNLLDFAWSETNPYSAAPAPENTFAHTSRISLPAGDALLLYNPGHFSPFERQNVYKSSLSIPEETWRVRTLIQDKGKLYPAASEPLYITAADSTDNTITIYASPGSAEYLRRPDNRYPFAVSYPEIYGTGREQADEHISSKLVLAIRSSNPGYNLESGTAPGSVTVKVNGITDNTVTVTKSGQLQFRQTINANDWIEVIYRTESLNLDGGDLFIYQGNQFRFTPALTWETAESVRWNISGQKSLEEYGQSPGSIQMASTLNWQKEKLKLGWRGEGILSTPDTTGTYRLFGMEKNGLGLVFFQNTAVGSPSSAAGIPQPPSGPLTGSRSPAAQYSYISTGILGSQILQNYLWPGASATGEDAPALAARLPGDPVYGDIMEIRFSLLDASGQHEWTSGDFLSDTQGPINLSAYSSMELPLKFLDDHGSHSLGSAPPRVIIQAGEIGESEDFHQDGTVNSPDPGALAQWDGDISADIAAGIAAAWNNPGTWQTLTLNFTPAQKARLTSVRSFRVIMENDTGSDMSGRVIMGAPRLAGSPFRTEIRQPDNSPAPGEDITGEEIPETGLATAFPETSELFHSGGSGNKALRIRWGSDVSGGAGISPLNRWEAVSWFEGVPLDAYRTMVFYVKASASQAGHPLTARITDSENRGITVNWSPADTAWDRITIDISSQSAQSANGAAVHSVSIDSLTEKLSRFLLSGTDASGSSNGVQSGTVYLDEIHFRDPAYSIAGAMEVNARWEYPQEVLRQGNFPVLGNITLEGRSGVSGGRVLSGLNRSSTAVTGDFTAGADVLGARLGTRWQVSHEKAETAWSGSHTLRIPAKSFPFWAEDAYSQNVSGSAATFSRRSTLNLSLAPGNIRFDAKSLHDGTALVQKWEGRTSWQGPWWQAGLNAVYTLETRDDPPEKTDYFSGWILRYAYVAPSRAAVYSHSAAHSMNILGKWGPVSLLWKPQLNMARQRYPSWNQENRWQGTLSVPVNMDGWKLNAQYYRGMRQLLEIPSGSSGSFLDSWSMFHNNLGRQLPFFSYMPFRELMGASDAATFSRLTDGQDQTDYTARFSLEASRSSSTPLIQLLLPSSARFSMERSYQRKNSTVGWQNTWRGSLVFSSANLFGRFGYYSFIPWYNNDQFDSLLQITLKDLNSPNAPALNKITAQTNWIFTGNRSSRMFFDYRLEWDWSSEKRNTLQEGRLEYQWRSESRDKLHLPLIKRVILRQHYLAHAERFSIQGSHPWKDAPESSKSNTGFLVRHETSWVFQNAGHLKGWLALGLGTRNAVLTNGWELGLEAEIRF